MKNSKVQSFLLKYLHDVDFLETLDEVVHESFSVLVVDKSPDELETANIGAVGTGDRTRVLLAQHAHFQHLTLVNDVLKSRVTLLS